MILSIFPYILNKTPKIYPASIIQRNIILLPAEFFAFHVLYIEKGQALPKQININASKISVVIFMGTSNN